jgi:2,4-dienoyl-CoA reductase-like NADH-dependent reductase (Old Yellow Enzyme family)
MSRYFRYKKADDLRREAQRLGLDVRLSDDLDVLWRPAEVGGRRVGNRLCVQPMEGCDGTLEGLPDELTYRRYRRFGAGGAKLIWGEAAAVVPEGRANTRQLLVNEANAAGLARIVDDCRRAHREVWGDDSDLLIGLQLTHSGRYSTPRPLLAQHDPLLDPRTVLDKASGQVAGPETPLLDDDYLDRLQDHYLAAARIAERAGFDFIDIKQCHKYLLCELLSSRTRPGKYGGPFENRTRLVREVVARLRDELPDLLIATRLNVYDGVPHVPGPDKVGVPVPFRTPVQSVWGARPDDPFIPDSTEPIRLVHELRRLGVGLINVSLGNPYAVAHVIRPFEYAPVDMYDAPEHPLKGVDRHFRLCGEVQRAVPDLPMVGSGYSWLQAFLFHAGAANVEDGRCAFVGVGRASLSHPDFAKNLKEGRPLDPKRTCRTFSYCTALMRSKHNVLGQFATGCPPFDKSTYGPIWDEARAGGAAQAGDPDEPVTGS